MLLLDPKKWHDLKEAARKEPLLGTIIVDFAAQWANLIEERMDSQKKLSEVAMDAAHEVLAVQPMKFGFNGQMMGMVIKTLAEHWAYGVDLKNWHSSLRA
jgi:hypothetical protein